MKARYTLAELQAMPTLGVGQTDNRKFDNGVNRVWLSRCSMEDGEPYDNRVSVEQYDPKTGRWEIVDEYEAK